MKKIFSTRYSDFSFNLSMFLIRVGFGSLLFYLHGLRKLQNFEERKHTFSDPLNIGSSNSMMLVIFAEVVCALLVVLGLFTRLASFVLVGLFIIVIFIIHKGDPFKNIEMAILFLLVFITTLLCGPGKWSIDKLIGK